MIDGRVAQSVEQRIENPRVTGSIPVPATKIYTLNQRLTSFCSESFFYVCQKCPQSVHQILLGH